MVGAQLGWLVSSGAMSETLRKIEDLDHHMGELRSSQIQLLASMACFGVFESWGFGVSFVSGFSHHKVGATG